MAKRKSNYNEILAKAKANKAGAELLVTVADASVDQLRIAVMAATLEVLGIDAEQIMAIEDNMTAGAYLMRAAYIGAADIKVGGFDRNDMVEMFNNPIEGEDNALD